MGEYKNIICDVEGCKHQFNLSDKDIKKHWLDKDESIEETYFICPKCKHKYVISITDNEIRESIIACAGIENEIRTLSDAVTSLINNKNKILNIVKKKSLELEKQWKQSN